jgi:hypothetical protein
MKRAALGFLLLWFAVSPQALGWKLADVGVPYVSEKLGYTIQFPPGWRYDPGVFAGKCLATRDGPDLAAVYVEVRKHKNAFKEIKQSSAADSLPQDLAQWYVANLQADRSIESLTVLSDEPAELAGLPAFRVHIAYRFLVDKGAVRYEEIVVGAVQERGLFVVGYRAPVLHYFAHYREDFEKSLASFAIQELAARK